MNDFRCHVSSSRYIRCVIRTIGRLIESNALNSENRISICTRYDGPIAFGVKLASFFVLFPVNIHPCYLSYIYFILLFNSTRSFMERTSCVIRKMLVPRKRIKTVFPFTSANSFTIFSHFLSKTRNFDKSFYKLFDSNFLSL